ncbi:MAG: carbamoyltransferase [Cyclobacteriaceae bacterium]
MRKVILGVSAFYHDSAAVLIIDGEIMAAGQEERFTRVKHDENFPMHAIRYVLADAGVGMEDVTTVVFYDKPWLKFERLLETYHAFAPSGLPSFLTAMPIWMKEKLFMKQRLRKQLSEIGKVNCPVLFSEHHLSHAASAFYPSPFQQAAILTIDGVGEWATTTIGFGTHNQIKIIKELHFPHSIGLLYSAFTSYIGFKVNGGEYKLMGLAAYGNPDSEQTRTFIDQILSALVDLREDGSLRLNMAYFTYATSLRMVHAKKWNTLFGIPPRAPEAPISQAYMDLSLAIQTVTEDIVKKLAKTARELTQSENLVMAGGVALNCVANGKLMKTNLFKNIWIQPAAGDAGGALGAAYTGWHIHENKARLVADEDTMKGALLGPEFSDKEIKAVLRKYETSYTYYSDFEDLAKSTAGKIAKGKVVGWFQGRMEFGPRALGNRSILGDPRNPDMQKQINVKIKFREEFRPFAPSVLEEEMQQYFACESPSPYMLITAPIHESRRSPEPAGYQEYNLRDRLYHCRSDIPAITHVNYSARIQSVNRRTNIRFHTLIKEFQKITDYGLLVNTSFNLKDQPIVCTPEQAYQCFINTEMDCLVLGNFVIEK